MPRQESHPSIVMLKNPRQRFNLQVDEIIAEEQPGLRHSDHFLAGKR